jgi:hypothetical protein
MSTSDARLIVSVHLAKTGGNTFATILERAATGLFCQQYGPDHPNTSLRVEGVPLELTRGSQALQLFDQLLAVPSIAARRSVLHGHMNADQNMTKYPEADVIVWFRDPVDRVVSHYEFWKRLEVDFDDPLYRRFHDEDMSIEEFAAEPRVRNAQNRTTGRRGVEDFAFIGITEQYDRSLDLFGRMYDVDTSDVVPLNFNPKQKRGRYDLPDDTRAVIESYNQIDLELYDQAVERFEALDATTRRPWALRRRLAAVRHRVGRESPDEPSDGQAAE